MCAHGASGYGVRNDPGHPPDRRTLARAGALLVELLNASPVVCLHMQRTVDDWAWVAKKGLPPHSSTTLRCLPLALPATDGATPQEAPSVQLHKCVELFRKRNTLLQEIQAAAGVVPKRKPLPEGTKVIYVRDSGVKFVNGAYFGVPGDDGDEVQKYVRRIGSVTLHISRFPVKTTRYWFLTDMGPYVPLPSTAAAARGSLAPATRRCSV